MENGKKEARMADSDFKNKSRPGDHWKKNYLTLGNT